VSTTAGLLDQAQQDAILAGLRRFMDAPEWLGRPGQPALVRAALERDVPEFASGALELRDLTIKRLRLKKGQPGWTGQYEITYAAPGAEPHTTMLAALIVPPGVDEPESAAQAAFGSPEWQVYLPDLRRNCALSPRIRRCRRCRC
jgi:hypothetical protein